MRVGYVGLGNMGAAMVENLCSTGATPTVFDLDTAAVERAVALGATAATSPGAVAAASEVVSICVPAAHHVDQVVTGDGGIIAGAHAGLEVLIHSTVHPDAMIAASNALAAVEASGFDACVAGGDDAARAGELVLFAGGYDDMSENSRSLLEIYGSKVIESGTVGGGAAIKIAVNILTYAQFAAVSAAFSAIEGSGTSNETLVEAWKHIGQLGALTERFLPVLTIPPEHVVGDFRNFMESTKSIAQKDLALALELCAGADETLADVLHSLHDAMPTVMRLTNEGQAND